MEGEYSHPCTNPALWYLTLDMNNVQQSVIIIIIKTYRLPTSAKEDKNIGEWSVPLEA